MVFMIKQLITSLLITLFLCYSGASAFAQYNDISEIQLYEKNVKSHESKYMKWHDQYVNSLQPSAIFNSSADYYTYDYTLDTVTLYSANANPKKFIYTYNEDSDREQSITQVYENEIWSNFSKQNFTYENGKLVKKIWQTWENDNWQNVSQTEYEYSASGKILEFVKMNWESGEWANAVIGTYTYDASDNMLAYLEEIWANDNWVNFSHELYTYDSVSNMLTAFGEIWDDSVWVNDQRHTYTYDPSGNQITTLSENWQEGTWIFLYRENKEYNENNMLTSSTGELWNDSLWVNDQYIEYTYNDLDYLTSRLIMLWQNDNWVNYSMSDNTYNGYGSLETSLIQHWNDDEWVNYDMSVNAYDENGNALQGNYYTWENGNWSQTADGIINLLYNHGLSMDSYSGYRADAYYTYLYVGCEENISKEQFKIKLVCNPVVDQLEFETQLQETAPCMAVIYDSRGNMIYQANYTGMKKGLNRYSINVSDINSGMYFLVISNGKEQTTNKIIIKQ